MLGFVPRLTQFPEGATSHRLGSALTPCLWLVGIVTPSGLAASTQTDGLVQIGMLVIAFIPILVASFGFLYFMVKAPDKLRSEQYELRKQALELVREKGKKTPVPGELVDEITNDTTIDDKSLGDPEE